MGADEQPVRARVTAERRGCWEVTDAAGQVATAVLAGTLRAAIDAGESDHPAVGDWIEMRTDPDAPGAFQIERVLPRRTCIARRSAGHNPRQQVVAANVDVVLIVCALGRDVNARRIERFAAIAWASGARPVLVLTKADLSEDPQPFVERARHAAPGIDVHLVSAVTGAGMEALAPYVGAGMTAVLLGTSGAGKSTLINAWLDGQSALATAPLGAAGKGRHTTTARQMFALRSGAQVIDTPGVREVGLWSADQGVSAAFTEISAYAGQCRFSDCAHDREPGCAVQAAVATGGLDPARVAAWQRLRREQTEAARPRPRGRRR